MLADRLYFREDAVMDFDRAGLLDGLEGEERATREKLLAQLAGNGVPLDQLKAAVAEKRLALLPVERVLGGRFTATEIEQRSGVPADMILRIRRLAGLPEAAPDEQAFAEEDIAMAQSTKLFLDAGFDEQRLAQLTRVLGEVMARLAATTTSSFVETFLKPGDSEADVALRFATLAEQLTPAMTPVLTAAFKAHLRESVRRGMLGRAELEAGQLAGSQEIAVCFADIVGFTRLGSEIELQDLGTVAGRLAELANEVSEGPVRLVKTIGDAAMFVSEEEAPLVQAALSLLKAGEAADMPALRAGIASGPAVIRAGDFYGNSVNLASRVTGVARPGSVLCTQAVRDAAPEDFDWSFAGRHKLKGVSEAPALFRARQLGTAPESARTPKEDRRRKRASR